MDMAARRASRKAAWRLIPFLFLCFFIAFLDRVNVGFAALTMNKELGLTSEMFGFGAGRPLLLLSARWGYTRPRPPSGPSRPAFSPAPLLPVALH
jgi:hypothetical protein